MNIMKKNEREPHEKEDRKLNILGWAFVIFYVILIVYLYTTKTTPNWMPKTIVIDVLVLYPICLITYCHIKYRDKR